jgi:hypothetical protein
MTKKKPLHHGILTLRPARPVETPSGSASPQPSATPSEYASDDEGDRPVATAERRPPFRVISAHNGHLSLRYLNSTSNSVLTTPQSSALPSAYPSDDEDNANLKKPSEKGPFPFLSLPSELRTKIYSHVFAQVPRVLDLDPDNFRNVHRKVLPLFLVSRQVHDEASYHFYSTHTFRIFPCHPGRFFKTKKPMLARLSRRYREAISSLELRFGPGWNKPPAGWVVNEKLGLKDTVNVRTLRVFVEVDPSHSIFTGFRKADGFYENFSQKLLADVLRETPTIVETHFDAWPSIKRSGDMLRGLLEIANDYQKIISWGPEGEWDKEENNAWDDGLLSKQGSSSVVSRSVAVLA